MQPFCLMHGFVIIIVYSMDFVVKMFLNLIDFVVVAKEPMHHF